MLDQKRFLAEYHLEKDRGIKSHSMKMYGSDNSKLAQKQRREALLQEGMTGKTIKDILPNIWFSWTGEAEAMYFKGARDFLRTSLAYNILSGHQNVADEWE